MSRAKKNWDHLVDETGNYYDISSSQGVKGQKGSPGLTGPKGDDGQMGRKGTKGDIGPAGPLFIWKGRVPTSADLPPALPGTNGWTYQTEDTGFFHVSNGNRTYSIVESVDVVKGDKGNPGDKGDLGVKGEKGVIGVKGAKGEVGEKGEAGVDADKGQKGEAGIDADKGEKGDKGDDAEETIPEAPNDNKTYLRKFNSWVASSKFTPGDTRSGLNINSVSGVGNPSYSVTNPHNKKYALAVGSVAQGNSRAFTAFYVRQNNNNCFVRNTMFVKSFAEGSADEGGREVAVKANLRSMRAALRQAVSEAVDFDDLKSKLITRLDSLEAELQDEDPNNPPSDPAD